jgi:hypothetical protein
MAKDYYLPRGDKKKAMWLSNFTVRLPYYAATLDISPSTLTSIQNDAKMFEYAIQLVDSSLKIKKTRTSFKNQLRDGPVSSTPLVMPKVSSPASPASVPPGIFKRVTALVRKIKVNDNYTPAIGKHLDIIGPETYLDMKNIKPKLKVRFIAGRTIIKYNRGRSDGVDIYVNQGDGKGFNFLATDNEPDYIDPTELPEGVKSAVWKYKARYRVDDKQVGKFSSIAEITVGI